MLFKKILMGEQMLTDQRMISRKGRHVDTQYINLSEINRLWYFHIMNKISCERDGESSIILTGLVI